MHTSPSIFIKVCPSCQVYFWAQFLKSRRFSHKRDGRDKVRMRKIDNSHLSVTEADISWSPIAMLDTSCTELSF
jgi:hypothetical protein